MAFVFPRSARELSKIHETFHRGFLGADLAPPFVDKGECVVLVEGGELKEECFSASEIDDFINNALKEGLLKPKEIAAKLAEQFGLKKNVAYEMVISKKGLRL